MEFYSLFKPATNFIFNRMHQLNIVIVSVVAALLVGASKISSRQTEDVKVLGT